MNTPAVLLSIDSEISRLKEVRALLSSQDRLPTRRTGKPVKKRVMSADTRARIAAVQRKRWAAWKKAKKTA